MKKYILTLLISFPLLADYSSHLEAESVIKELTEEHGFDKSYVLKILSNAKKQQKIIDSISTPAEFTWTWDRYKKLFLEEKRIANGKIFLAENKNLFNRVEDEFGVP